MRYLLLIFIATSAFALTPNPNWTYEAGIDTTGDTLVSEGQITTVPASGTFGVAVDAPILIATPELCTVSNPPGWYDFTTGARYFLQGQLVNPGDSLSSGDWTVGPGGSFEVDFYLAPNPSGGVGSLRDTVGFCAAYFDSVPAQSYPVDTFYLSVLASSFPSIQDNVEFLYPCGDDCDSCGFIVYCDPPATPTLYDTLTIQRAQDWPKFYQVEWFIRNYTVTGLMYDTLIYVTEGDTMFYANRTPMTVLGTGQSGSATITGWRSAGMDVYTTSGRVVSSVDSEEVNLSHIPFSFTWSGLEPSVVESLYVWGVSYNGESSDTTVLRRRYLNTNEGQFNRR